MHTYSLELENTLNQLSTDLNNGRIKWGELKDEGTKAFATQVSSITKDSFSNLEENFHEYSGLIYDGAFSEHITSSEKKGLTGEDIDEEKAKEIVKTFYGEEKIKNIDSNGFSENAEIPSFDFNVKMKENDNTATISISKKGCHVVALNYNREVTEEKISEQDAVQKGKEYLTSKGFNNMQETYYLKENGFITVNYAYKQGDVVMYADLIKVKIALDDGEVIGLETTGYLNCHYDRTIPTNKISIADARKHLSDKAQVTSEGLAMIPTEWKTEKLPCACKASRSAIGWARSAAAP